MRARGRWSLWWRSASHAGRRAAGARRRSGRLARPRSRGPWELAADAERCGRGRPAARASARSTATATSSGPRRSTASLPGAPALAGDVVLVGGRDAASPRSRVRRRACAGERPMSEPRPTRSRSPATSRWRATAAARSPRSTVATGEVRWSVALRRFALVGAARRPRDRRGRRHVARDRRARGAGLRPRDRRAALAGAHRPVLRRPGRCTPGSWCSRSATATGTRVGRGARPRHRRAALADRGAGVVRGGDRARGRRPGRGGGRPLRRGHRARSARRAGFGGSTTSPERCSAPG